MLKHCLLLFLLVSFNSYSQNLEGRIFDQEEAVKDIEVINLSKNVKTYSNEEGYFSIRASVNDSIQMQSLFHESKIFVVNPSHFQDAQVFQLKKRVNELTEVNIYKESDSIQFKEKEQSANLKKSVEADMAKYPLLYEKQKPVYAVDLVVIAGYISKLFKKKPPSLKNIQYGDLTKLFETSSFFTTDMLTEELNIPEKYIPLFFEYCEVQYFDRSLLEKDNELILLDELDKTSKSFIKLLEEHNNKD